MLIRLARWTLFFLLTIAGAVAAFRYPLITYARLPEGLRIVLNIQLVGLVLTAVVESVSPFGQALVDWSKRKTESKQDSPESGLLPAAGG